MDDAGNANRAVFRTTLFAAVGALLLGAVVIGTRSALASGPEPSIGCDLTTTVYGDEITCGTAGSDVAGILWPDGASSPSVQATHAPKAVGSVEVAAVSESGEILAATTVSITPDIDIECEAGEAKIVYKLATSVLRSDGWDYVYLDPATGTEIAPGDAAHPNGGAETGLERIELDRVNKTRFCQIDSAAADELGGDYRVTLVSPWEGTVSHPVKFIDPASKTRWAGAQRGELTATVAVNGVEASERRGVYMAGCN